MRDAVLQRQARDPRQSTVQLQDVQVAGALEVRPKRTGTQRLPLPQLPAQRPVLPHELAARQVHGHFFDTPPAPLQHRRPGHPEG